MHDHLWKELKEEWREDVEDKFFFPFRFEQEKGYNYIHSFIYYEKEGILRVKIVGRAL